MIAKSCSSFGIINATELKIVNQGKGRRGGERDITLEKVHSAVRTHAISN